MKEYRKSLECIILESLAVLRGLQFRYRQAGRSVRSETTPEIGHLEQQ